MNKLVHSRSRVRKAAGFSMVELLFVIAIIMVVTGIALVQVSGTLQRAKADTALQIVLGQMRVAHERAIDERRIYRLSFVSPRTIQLDRMELDAGGAYTAVAQGSIDIPAETQFTVVSGIPTAATPDSMGVGNRAIDFSIDYGGAGTQVFFQPDGRALDSANRLNNGVVYMARPGDLLSSRAVSLFGATGRVKGWFLVMNGNSPEWRQ
ncbi:MAG TPA: prepilin-type N-terminal cleavage/methylation domain-containing protein [Terriglobales bacterium]|nr:prepilin-type N-terminal cleavage/methylation domain-containing protein [Terriglobales bacterium]